MPLKRRGRPAMSANSCPQPPGGLLFALVATLGTTLTFCVKGNQNVPSTAGQAAQNPSSALAVPLKEPN